MNTQARRPAAQSLSRGAFPAGLIALCTLLTAPDAGAVPIPLGNRLSLIADGTSNTLLFTETTTLTLCFDGISAPATIQDGTSNTILFGESSSLTVVGGFLRGRGSVTEIADGSSNTIIIGESDGFCLGGTRPIGPGTITDGSSNTIILPEDASIDVCATNVQHEIVDGTSNTISIGETLPRECHEGVRVDRPRDAAAVAEPETLLLLLLGGGLLGLAAARRRRTAA